MVFGVWEGVGGEEVGSKTASSWNSDPQYYGALFRSERFYWSLRVAKNGTFQFGGYDGTEPV